MEFVSAGDETPNLVMEQEIKVEMVDEEPDFDTLDFLKLAYTVESAVDISELNSSEYATNPKTGNTVCLHCLQEFPAHSLIEHMTEIHNYRKIIFKCHVCKSTFKKWLDLKVHKTSCKLPGKRSKKSLCHIMGVVKNLVGEYPEVETAPCPVCNLDVNKEFLREHVMLEHNKHENLKCELCHRTFKNKLTLREHIKLVHLSLHETEQCDECGQKFRSQKYLRNHKRNVHPTGNKIHQCQYCNKIFKSRLCVHQHQKHVHPPISESVICELCNKRFKSKWNLAQHIRGHAAAAGKLRGAERGVHVS